MKNKWIVWIVAIALALSAFVGCAPAAQAPAAEAPAEEAAVEAAPAEEAAAQEAPATDKPVTVGFVAMNTYMTWMQYAIKGAQEAAEAAGAEFLLFDAENDVAKQTAMVEDAVAQGVDVVVTDPINVESLTPALIAAADAGVPVVTFDRRAEGAKTIAHVGSDDVATGRRAAEFIGEKLGGKGRVIELVGQSGSSPAIDRGNGFHSVMEEKYPDIEIVFSQSGEFEREKGMAVMEDAIVSVGEFDAVFSHNDDMMMGAIQAIKDAGIDFDKVLLVSIDGIPDALKALQSGELDATIQFPVALGGEAVKVGLEYLKNGSVANDNINIDSWVITKDNVDSGDFYPEIAG